MAEVRLTMQADHDAALKLLEEESSVKLVKAHKQTRLMVCLQNRVREMVAKKLEEATRENLSLKEDMKDVTESHNLKVIALREQLEKEKADETAILIKKNEELMAEMEAKIRKEVAESSAQNDQDKMHSLIEKLENDHGSALDEQRSKLEALTKTHQEELTKR